MDNRQYRTTDLGGREWRVTAAWGDHNDCYYLDLCRFSTEGSPERHAPDRHTKTGIPTFSDLAFTLQGRGLRFPPGWARDLLNDRLNGPDGHFRDYGMLGPDVEGA
jgi:hypothetical protein